MARYASGKKSVAISDRGGFKVRYTDLKTTWDGLRVEKEEWEPKHPQLSPARNVVDATALFKPRSDNDPENVRFIVGFNNNIFASKIEKAQKGIGIKGQGSVATLPSFSFNFGANSGVATATGAIGTISINLELEETAAVGTGAIGTAIITAKITEVGVAGTAGIGSVLINFQILASVAVGTGVIGVEIPTASITEAGVAGTAAIGDATDINIGGWGNEGWNVGTWGDG